MVMESEMEWTLRASVLQDAVDRASMEGMPLEHLEILPEEVLGTLISVLRRVLTAYPWAKVEPTRVVWKANAKCMKAEPRLYRGRSLTGRCNNGHAWRAELLYRNPQAGCSSVGMGLPNATFPVGGGL